MLKSYASWSAVPAAVKWAGDQTGAGQSVFGIFGTNCGSAVSPD